MNQLSAKSHLISRRRFLRNCSISVSAIASLPILAGRTLGRFETALTNSPASLKLSLNQNWLFGGKFDPKALRAAFDDRGFSKVNLPHCVAKLSWQGWDPSEWEDVWIYRRHFSLPRQFENRRVYLDFDGVMNTATPVFNGQVLPKHAGGYLPFQYEITDHLTLGNNVLAVALDARWNPVPPDGNPKGPTSIDYLEAGGIVRSVTLRAVPQIFISNVFAKPVAVLDPGRRIQVKCTLDAAVVPEKPLQLKVDLLDGGLVLASTTTKSMKLDKPGEIEITIELSKLGNVKLWDVDAPQLYHVLVTLLLDGKPLHDYRTRIGLREARFEVDGFFLNGRRFRFMGLNRHEIFPYVGFAMPSRVMRRDAEIIRHTFNCNMVRCSHYLQTEAFLDACDELGLMVWEEPPGWGYQGDVAWKEMVVRDIREMIRRDRNHPSIIIWGVRVNESRNDPTLYERTKALAYALDGSRPTSGSMTSHSTKGWHQDVFALDDYHSAPDGSVAIKAPLPDVPYMVSECVGQYSYGNLDQGFRNFYRRAGDLTLQTSQALYHAQAHDGARAYPRFCGAIAWCAFDYSSQMNGYNEVKYPGVADIFRIPKLGASFYQSQVNPKTRLVIEPNFYWDFGVLSPQGPGRHAAIFSNCERLDIFVGGKQIAGVWPDHEHYPYLDYPPFFCDLDITEAIAKTKPDLRIDGYVGDALTLSRQFSSNPKKDRLFFAADDEALLGDGVDATRLVFKVVDQFGANRAFGGGEIRFEVTGPGIIVGDNPFTLMNDCGGAGAVWLKSVSGKSGLVNVKATHSFLGEKSVTVSVRRMSSLFNI